MVIAALVYAVYVNAFLAWFKEIPPWLRTGLIAIGYLPCLYFLFCLCTLLLWSERVDPTGGSSGMTAFAAGVFLIYAVAFAAVPSFFVFYSLLQYLHWSRCVPRWIVVALIGMGYIPTLFLLLVMRINPFIVGISALATPSTYFLFRILSALPEKSAE